MFDIGKRFVSLWLPLAIVSAAAAAAPSACATDIPCARFKDQCRSLKPPLAPPPAASRENPQAGARGLPVEYAIADSTEIAPGYQAVVLARGPHGQAAQRWGVFIVNAAGKHVLTLDTFPQGAADDLASIQLGKHTGGTLVVAGYGSHGDRVILTKYFFDLAARKKLGAISDGVDVDVPYVIAFKGMVYCIGNAATLKLVERPFQDNIVRTSRALIAVMPQPAPGQPLAGIKLVDRIDGKNMDRILDASVSGDTLVLIGEHHRYTLAHGTWQARAAAAPQALNGRRGEPWRQPDQGVMIPGHPAWRLYAHEIANTRSGRRYPVPAPAYALFSRWRPQRVADGYTEKDTALESDIGPWQEVDGKLWFGIAYYDGEGASGVGGIGVFDFATGKYKMDYRREIAGDSAFAMRVEPDTIWLGLGVQPEGWEYGSGVARISRAHHTLVRYPVPDIVNAFVRIGSKVYAATRGGVTAFDDDGRVDTLDLSINRDGSYSPVVRQAQRAASGK